MTLRSLRSLAGEAPRASDGVRVALVGLSLRLAVVAWAAPRFPPAEDGRFYDVVAARIAAGLGYTWQWPDGVVTYAAHYPVGYPALIGAAYAVAGAKPAVAMVVNAVVGAALVLAVHRVASAGGSRLGALVAALGVALHPGLLGYVPALMTEGAAAAALALASWVAVAAPASGPGRGRIAALGGVLGLGTLVRPQTLLLAPLFGALAGTATPRARRLSAAALVTAAALAVCAPWTARNCVRMGSCVLVSANGGWNLFIGAAGGATGAWVPLERLGVPEECRTVWDEAGKDACFGRAGRRAIAADPVRFLSLVPAKLAATFDYAGAAGWYLHASAKAAFDDGAKLALGVAETLWQRLLLLGALAAVARAEGPRPLARRLVAGGASAFLLARPAWVAHVALSLGAALLGRQLPARPALALGAATVAATALTHAAFFGAGRYSLVCFPAIAAMAAAALTRAPRSGDTDGSKES